MVPSIKTQAGVTLFIGGKPYSVASGDRSYGEIIDLMKQPDASEEAFLEVIERAARELAESLAVIGDSGVAIRADGLVTLHDKVIDNSLTRRMIQMRAEGFDLVPMARFLANLDQNPSYRARKELYTFLEVGQLPLTPDGHFLAYKIVKADYRDYHSGTYDNSIGQVCRMPRSDVDDDCNRTCSAGLHFCSLDYLQHFGGADGHVMILKINPRDVVSIPADYNNTKGRCCEYEVIAEYSDYRRDHPLPAFTGCVADFEDFEDDDAEEFPVFTVFSFGSDAQIEADLESRGESYADAVRMGERLLAAGSAIRVLIQAEESDEVVRVLTAADRNGETDAAPASYSVFYFSEDFQLEAKLYSSGRSFDDAQKDAQMLLAVGKGAIRVLIQEDQTNKVVRVMTPTDLC
ncbi:hypothetical protein [Thiomonas sp.]